MAPYAESALFNDTTHAGDVLGRFSAAGESFLWRLAGVVRVEANPVAQPPP